MANHDQSDQNWPIKTYHSSTAAEILSQSENGFHVQCTLRDAIVLSTSVKYKNVDRTRSSPTWARQWPLRQGKEFIV